MATKSKKFKNSIITKLICVLLSAITFFICCSGVLIALITIEFCYEIPDLPNNLVSIILKGTKPDFFECDNFLQQVRYSVSSIDTYVGADLPKTKEELYSQNDNYVNKAVQQYSLKKAEIIRNELVYIADNYFSGEDSVYNLNGYSEAIYNSIPDVPADEQKYPVDIDAPKTVQMVQKILNYAKGTEFLKYSSLVRKDAFNESEFHFSENGYYLDLYDFTRTVESVRTIAENQFKELVNNNYGNTLSNWNVAKKQVKGFKNVFYYVKRGDKVYTNMENPQQEIENIKNQECHIYKKDGEFISQNIVDSETFPYYNYGSNWDELLQACDTAAIYVNTDIVHGDGIGDVYEEYVNLPQNINNTLISVILSFLLFVASVGVLISSCGHKNGADGISLMFIDKLPTDIHLALSVGLGAGVFGLSVLYFGYFGEFDIKGMKIAALLLTIEYLILIEWILSVIRLKKAKKSWFKNLFLIKLILWAYKYIKKLVLKIYAVVSKPIYKYKPKHLDKKIIFIFIALFIINFVLIFGSIPFFAAGPVFIGVMFLAWSAGLDFAVLFYLKKYISMLDKIIDASTRRESVSFGEEKVPESLETLNNSIKISNEEMEKAVEKAVKNERTKAELITNVSHDLKTPLTSIISYVELLKKCDIQNDDAQKYISVLSDKSQNLKSLIENLIEASKASTGNIKLNKVTLNFNELVAQAVAEFVSDFEERGLELRFDEPNETINALVDGQQTFRILENLLSNAKKYSATGTRVYASIRREENNAVFELKNISKDPLNISPDELTERFVRGDSSRGTEEGNGLGLSIAKQLCLLQSGKLDLQIDGDLFKATVYLPMR